MTGKASRAPGSLGLLASLPCHLPSLCSSHTRLLAAPRTLRHVPALGPLSFHCLCFGSQSWPRQPEPLLLIFFSSSQISEPLNCIFLVVFITTRPGIVCVCLSGNFFLAETVLVGFMAVFPGLGTKYVLSKYLTSLWNPSVTPECTMLGVELPF